MVKSSELVFDMNEKEPELGHYYVDKAEVSEEDIEYLETQGYQFKTLS